MTPRVFLCEPSGLTVSQRARSDQWHERLFGFGFDVDQLRPAEYEADLWPRLKARMDVAHGVVVLGFRQLVIGAGSWRRCTEHETDVAGTWTSPWLHTEVGLAIAAGLPLLIAPESGVEEGVFASETWTDSLCGTSIEAPDADIVAAWAGSVAARFATRI